MRDERVPPRVRKAGGAEDHVIGALENEIVKAYPIDAKQETARNGAPAKKE